MATGKFAGETTVSPEASRAEIEKTLVRYGATDFGYLSQQEKAMVMFALGGRQVRLILNLPDRNARDFTHTPARGQLRSPTEQVSAYDKAVRQKWRALALVVKAKLEAVESQIVTFDEEFLAHMILPGGESVFEHVREGVEKAYLTGRVKPLIAIGS